MKSRLVVTHRAAAQAAALLAAPALPRQHREARRLLRAWKNQQYQPRPVARYHPEGNDMTIINLTQHPATAEQIEAGVIDLSPDDRAVLAQALTFDDVPDQSVLNTRATTIALMAAGHSSGARSAMIGGAPYFMYPLERALWAASIRPLYAFSKRDSIERVRPSGAVEKINVFRHVGFVGTEFMEPRR